MNFLGLPYDVLWSIGIFSSSSSSKWMLWPWALYVYRAILFVFLITVIILMTVQLCVSPDLSILARTIDFWTLFLSGTYKWTYMAKFSDEFTKLSTDLIKIHAQGATVCGKAANQLTSDYLKQIRPIALLYLFSGFFGAVLMIASPLIAFPMRDRSESDYFNDPKSYPFSYVTPFMINDYWTFSIFFACHCMSAFLIVLIYLGIDSFMFGAIYAVGGQIELLNSSIKTIENSVSDDFSSLIIVDYLHGITSLTFALFQLSYGASGVSESLAILFFIFISGFHQFLNNYFGEFIVQKQLSVGFVSYNVPWWRMDKKCRYLLTLMILRSKKPTLITGFYMYKLCNNSFITFVKTSYSYYMVLRRLNVEH